jgi:hypothetical protein
MQAQRTVLQQRLDELQRERDASISALQWKILKRRCQQRFLIAFSLCMLCFIVCRALIP